MAQYDNSEVILWGPDGGGVDIAPRCRKIMKLNEFLKMGSGDVLGEVALFVHVLVVETWLEINYKMNENIFSSIFSEIGWSKFLRDGEIKSVQTPISKWSWFWGLHFVLGQLLWFRYKYPICGHFTPKKCENSPPVGKFTQWVKASLNFKPW